MYQFLIEDKYDEMDFIWRIEFLQRKLFRYGIPIRAQGVENSLYTEVMWGNDSIFLLCQEEITVICSYEDLEEGNVLLDSLIEQFLLEGNQFRLLHLSNFQPLIKTDLM